MRFIFNFIFFGILFFLIWRFFPEAFTTLVGWVSAVWDFISEVIVSVFAKVKTASVGGVEHKPV